MEQDNATESKAAREEEEVEMLNLMSKTVLKALAVLNGGMEEAKRKAGIEVAEAKGKERIEEEEEEEEEMTDSALKEAFLLDSEEIKECVGCQELMKVVNERDAAIFKILSCVKGAALKQSQVIEEMIRLQKEKEAFYFEWIRRNYMGIDETQK